MLNLLIIRFFANIEEIFMIEDIKREFNDNLILINNSKQLNFKVTKIVSNLH